MNSLKGPGVAVAVRFEVLWSHRDGGLEHLHEHHVAHHPEQTCHDKWSKHTKLVERFRGKTKATEVWFRYLPPRTVKTAAKALSSCPQRCVDGQQVLMHSCTDSSVQLINSSPMYMSSNVSDSHIIAVEWGEDRHDMTVIWILKQSANPRAKCLQTCRKSDESIYLFQNLESKYKTLGTSRLQIKRQM